MTKHNGRMLSNDTLKIRAEEVMVCLQLWGLGQADSYYLARHMKFLVASCKPADWKNPLEGSGLTAPQLVDAVGVREGLGASIPEKPVSANLAAAFANLDEKKLQ